MKVYFTVDERYPDVEMHTKPYLPGDNGYDIDARTLARWRKTIAAYDAVQKEMRKAMEEGRAPK